MKGKPNMLYDEFLSMLSNPARCALEREGISSFEGLASLSKKELLQLHGIGPRSLPIVERCLDSIGMKLRD